LISSPISSKIIGFCTLFSVPNCAVFYSCGIAASTPQFRTSLYQNNPAIASKKRVLRGVPWGAFDEEGRVLKQGTIHSRCPGLIGTGAALSCEYRAGAYDECVFLDQYPSRERIAPVSK
jgi:hypothetical protein